MTVMVCELRSIVPPCCWKVVLTVSDRAKEIVPLYEDPIVIWETVPENAGPMVDACTVAPSNTTDCADVGTPPYTEPPDDVDQFAALLQFPGAEAIQ